MPPSTLTDEQMAAGPEAQSPPSPPPILSDDQMATGSVAPPATLTDDQMAAGPGTLAAPPATMTDDQMAAATSSPPSDPFLDAAASAPREYRPSPSTPAAPQTYAQTLGSLATEFNAPVIPQGQADAAQAGVTPHASTAPMAPAPAQPETGAGWFETLGNQPGKIKAGFLKAGANAIDWIGAQANRALEPLDMDVPRGDLSDVSREKAAAMTAGMRPPDPNSVSAQMIDSAGDAVTSLGPPLAIGALTGGNPVALAGVSGIQTGADVYGNVYEAQRERLGDDAARDLATGAANRAAPIGAVASGVLSGAPVAKTFGGKLVEKGLEGVGYGVAQAAGTQAITYGGTGKAPDFHEIAASGGMGAVINVGLELLTAAVTRGKARFSPRVSEALEHDVRKAQTPQEVQAAVQQAETIANAAGEPAAPPQPPMPAPPKPVELGKAEPAQAPAAVLTDEQMAAGSTPVAAEQPPATIAPVEPETQVAPVSDRASGGAEPAVEHPPRTLTDEQMAGSTPAADPNDVLQRPSPPAPAPAEARPETPVVSGAPVESRPPAQSQPPQPAPRDAGPGSTGSEVRDAASAEPTPPAAVAPTDNVGEVGIKKAFGTAKNAATDGFVDSMWGRVEAGHPIDPIGPVEQKLRAAQDAGQLRDRSDVAFVVANHYGPQRKNPGTGPAAVMREADRRQAADQQATRERAKQQPAPAAPKDMADFAAQRFGTTENPAETGFLLPNGRMLDMRGGAPEGQRYLEHAGTAEEILERSPNEFLRETPNLRGADQHLSAMGGVARIVLTGESGFVSTVRPLTPEQVGTIRQHSGNGRIEIGAIQESTGKSRSYKIPANATTAQVAKILGHANEYLRGGAGTPAPSPVDLHTPPSNPDSTSAEPSSVKPPEPVEQPVQPEARADDGGQQQPGDGLLDDGQVPAAQGDSVARDEQSRAPRGPSESETPPTPTGAIENASEQGEAAHSERTGAQVERDIAPPAPAYTPEHLSGLKGKELTDLAVSMGVKKGSKKAMIDGILAKQPAEVAASAQAPAETPKVAPAPEPSAIEPTPEPAPQAKAAAEPAAPTATPADTIPDRAALNAMSPKAVADLAKSIGIPVGVKSMNVEGLMAVKASRARKAANETPADAEPAPDEEPTKGPTMREIRAEGEKLQAEAATAGETITEQEAQRRALKRLRPPLRSGHVALPDLGPVLDKVKQAKESVGDYMTLDALPKASRAGVADEMVAHAAAAQAAPYMAADKLAKVGDQGDYKKPEVMRKTAGIIRDDNILGGYDAINARLTTEKANEAKLHSDFKDGKKAYRKATGLDKARIGKKLLSLRRKAKDSVKAQAGLSASLSAIEGAHDLPSLDARVEVAKSDPTVMRHVENWKQHVEPEATQHYNELKGVDPNTPQPTRGRHLGARMNLLAVDADGVPIDPRLRTSEENPDLPPSAASGNLKNPNVKKDKFNQRASLTGQYSDDMALILHNAIDKRWNEVTKLRLFNAMEIKGVAAYGYTSRELRTMDEATLKDIATKRGLTYVDRKQAARAIAEHRPTEIDGQPARALPVKVPRSTADGTEMVERTLYVRNDLYKETRTALATDMQLEQHPIAKVLTGLQMASGVDAVAHTFNQWRLASNSLGEKTALRDLAKKIPGVGAAKGAADMARTLLEVHNDGPEVRADLAEMARKGYIRPEYPSEGVGKLPVLKQISTAIHKNDTAVRLIMLRHWRNLVARGDAPAGGTAERDFVNQLGQYNARLMGPVMNAARKTGLAPFIVAGRNFNRQGVRYLTSGPGFKSPTAAAWVRNHAIQLGLPLAAAATPAMLNYLAHGSVWGRPGTPVGAYDTGSDDEKGKHKVIDFLQFEGVRRGMNRVGMTALIEGLRQGKNANQIGGDMVEQAEQTNLHPFIGPGASFLAKAATGKQLDIRGQMDANLVKGGGLAQNAEYARAAAESQNPAIYAAGKLAYKAIDPKQHVEAQDVKDFAGGMAGKAAASAAGYKSVPAPQTAAEDLAATLNRAKFGGGGVTEEDESRMKLSGELLAKLKASKVDGQEAVREAVDAGKLTAGQAKTLQKKSGMSRLEWDMNLLTPADAVDVYKQATPAEKEQVKDLLGKKVMRSTNLDTAAKQATLKDAGVEYTPEMRFHEDLHVLRQKKAAEDKADREADEPGGDRKANRDAAKAARMSNEDAKRLMRLEDTDDYLKYLKRQVKSSKLTQAEADRRARALIVGRTKKAG